jgi:hypothetical protein
VVIAIVLVAGIAVALHPTPPTPTPTPAPQVDYSGKINALYASAGYTVVTPFTQQSTTPTSYVGTIGGTLNGTAFQAQVTIVPTNSSAEAQQEMQNLVSSLEQSGYNETNQNAAAWTGSNGTHIALVRATTPSLGVLPELNSGS